jgi:hypothetical protein
MNDRFVLCFLHSCQHRYDIFLQLFCITC